MGLKEVLNYVPFPDQERFTPGKFNPGLFKLNKEKLKKLRPQVFGLGALKHRQLDSTSYIINQMNDGDMQPAVVVSVDPLLVACYNDEFDAAILLWFPAELGRARGWELYHRLMTVNAYNGFGLLRKNKDIDPGPRASAKFKSVGPLVADLYTDDIPRLERKKSEVPEELWAYTIRLGEEYMQRHPGMARDGLDFRFLDAKPIAEMKVHPKARLD